MTLGDAIKKYRLDHDMSMEEFAKKSGISKAYVSVIENNKHPKTGQEVIPSVTTIKKAANGMGLSFSELFNSINTKVSIPSQEEEITLLITNAQNRGLSEEESYIVDSYLKLDETGRSRFMAYLEYLLYAQKKTKDTSSKMA